MTPAREKATPHVSTFDLDRIEMGALEGEQRVAIEAHVALCSTCREEQAALRAGRAEFSREVLPRTALALRGRLRQQRRWFAQPRVWAPALACAAGLVLLLGRPKGLLPTDEETVHTKGSSELLLIARQRGRVFAVDRFNHQLGRG